MPEISEWYNRYTARNGLKLYNPRSVICALEDGCCQSYWTKSGKGFADFIFYPKAKHLPGIIIELTADSTPETALRQIKEKEYCEKLLNAGVENILLTGISYDTVKKVHQCRIEKFLTNTPFTG